MTIFSQRPGVFCTPTIGLLFAVSSVGICFFAVSSAKAQAVDVQPEPGQQVAIADEDSAAAQVAADDYELLRLFIDTLDEVERNYVKPISRRELMEAAIDGVLSKLDVYSDYIPPDEFDEFSRDVTNEFGGLGIQVTMENGELTVISPLIGTPAYEAGIVAGDVITKIGDSETKGMDLSGAIRAMKGPVNTAVNLTIRKRNGSEKQVSVTREIVRIETVLGYQRQADDNWSFWFDQDRKIGYVRITAFSQQTDADLKQALDTLKADGMKAFVLDLRFNPGGLLTSAIAISDMFLSEGRIVSTSGRNIAEEAWDAHSEGTFTG
ncbi:MAG: PDZ domain-containing protein, partial [Planctomycetales bacterium]|nr:PDZ domain-containing protein [Planctomycetales bacterium]